MQLDYYDDGLGFSLKSALKKIGNVSRKIAFPIIPKPLKPLAAKLDAVHMKVIDKVGVPVVHAAAAYFTGGATLALSAKMLMDEKRKKAEAAQMAGDQAEYERQMAEIKAMEAQQAGGSYSQVVNPPSGPRPPLNTATPAAPVTTITAVAPTQAAVQQQVSQAQLQPTYITIPSDRPSYPAEQRQQPMQVAPRAALPTWAIPAGVGVLALVGVAMVATRPRR